MSPIYFSKQDMNILYEYLNRKYMKRASEYGRGYTVGKFAEEVGLKYGTMLRLLDPKVDAKGMEFETLQKLAQHFGSDFLRELRLLKD